MYLMVLALMVQLWWLIPPGTLGFNAWG